MTDAKNCEQDKQSHYSYDLPRQFCSERDDKPQNKIKPVSTPPKKKAGYISIIKVVKKWRSVKTN